MNEADKKHVANDYRNKIITVRGAADLLRTGYYEAQDILAEEGVPVTDLTEGEIVERKTRGLKDKY